MGSICNLLHLITDAGGGYKPDRNLSRPALLLRQLRRRSGRLRLPRHYAGICAAGALLEQEQGQSTHLNAARWYTTNAVQGDLLYNVSTPWTWGTAQSIFYYMLLDPAATTASDPRPSFPLNTFDSQTGRVLAHSSWDANATWFDYRASWESINHQQGDAGEFELFRNGEWLTKEMSNYDNNLVGFTPYYLNSLCLKNWCSGGTPNLGWDETGIWANGGQWMWAENAGDPVTVSSNGTGYTYASSDLTPLYNRPEAWTASDNATDITQANRSVLWLNNDYVVVYDRATSIHSGLFKTFNLSMATDPVINGNVATETLADGQKLFVQTLLPQSAALTARLASNDLSPHADFDPMKLRSDRSGPGPSERHKVPSCVAGKRSNRSNGLRNVSHEPIGHRI